MVNSNSVNLEKKIDIFIKKHHLQDERICVGISGGADSVALLHAFKSLEKKYRFNLSAIHINHKVSNRSFEWEKFCARLCIELSVPLKIERIDCIKKGASLESILRKKRHNFFVKQASGVIALGHHLDDQIETFMMNLLRGSGLTGLQCMKKKKYFKKYGFSIIRPFLDIQKTKLQIYLKQKNQSWISDDSNNNIDYTRNYWRKILLPEISKKYPSYRKNITNCISNLNSSYSIESEITKKDFNEFSKQNQLNTNFIEEISKHRSYNLIRYFLKSNLISMPSRKKIEEIVNQLSYLRSDSNFSIDFNTHDLKKFQSNLYIVKKKKIRKNFKLFLTKYKNFELPDDLGTFSLKKTKGMGINLKKIEKKELYVTFRKYGEKIKIFPKNHHQKLKKIFQEQNIPTWERDAIPLLFCEDDLVWVPHVGISSNFIETENKDSLLVVWKCKYGIVDSKYQ